MVRGQKGRYELVDGWIVAIAPERGTHLRVKGSIYKALDRAVAVAGVPCQALPDGATVETGDSDYDPDAMVNCGEPTADDAMVAPSVPSVLHYLIVHPSRRTVTHHCRTGDGIDTRIIVNGPITMEPPVSSSLWKKSTALYRPIVLYNWVPRSVR